MPQISDRDCKTQALAEDQFHVGHADYFALQIEQRAAAVAGVNLGRGLNICQTFEVAIPCTDNPLRYGSLQAQWITNREDLIPFVQVLVLRNEYRPEFQIFLSLICTRARSKYGFKAMILTSSIRRRVNSPGRSGDKSSPRSASLFRSRGSS